MDLFRVEKIFALFLVCLSSSLFNGLTTVIHLQAEITPKLKSF